MSSSQKKTSSEQQEIMLDFMRNNKSLLNNKFTMSFTKQVRASLWQELTEQLNCDGSGPTKNSEAWQKSWNDWKYGVRQKASRILQHQRGTGGGGICKDKLTDLEQSLLGVLGETSVAGLRDTVPEGGFGTTSAIASASNGTNTADHEDGCIPPTNKKIKLMQPGTDIVATALAAAINVEETSMTSPEGKETFYFIKDDGTLEVVNVDHAYKENEDEVKKPPETPTTSKTTSLSKMKKKTPSPTASSASNYDDLKLLEEEKLEVLKETRDICKDISNKLSILVKNQQKTSEPNLQS